MKITNRTKYPTRALRRMVSWICKQLPFPVSQITELEVGNHSQGNSGTVDPVGYKRTGRLNDRRRNYLLKLWLKEEPAFTRNAVYTAVFYLAHAEYHNEKSNWTSSAYCQREADRIADRWQAQKQELWTEWSKPDLRETAAPIAVGDVLDPSVLLREMQSNGRPKKSKKQVNAERAQAHLANWERKLKMAQTKVRKYRRQVRRYVREGVLEES
jgi:hypothetical protein